MFSFKSLFYSFLAVLLLETNGIIGHTDKTSIAEHTSFCLYTRASGNKCTKLVYNDSSTISSAILDTSKPIKLIIPGWFDPLYNEVRQVRQAFLEAYDVNVITFNWLYYTFNARAVLVPVGQFVAEFIDWLVRETKVMVESIHMVGFSLGSQLAGVIGEHVSVGKLGRITGLDPVGLTFDSNHTSGRLDSSDALFVDVIHTCDGLIGFSKPCGHADFYPNGGTFNQPGCPVIDFGVFSHLRAFHLFVESINNSNFVARACDTWDNFKSGQCANRSIAIMGERVMTSARGNFYLHTSKKTPFALGEDAA